MGNYELPVMYHECDPVTRRRVREQYIREQSGKCWYCEEPLSCQPAAKVMEKKLDLSLFPPNFLKHPVHLQHDHYTGLTEGAVHAKCNGVLWQYEGR